MDKKKPVKNENSDMSKPNSLNMAKLIFKIQNSIDYHSIFCLEEEFNKVGLTLQTTAQNRVILCRIHNNKPLAEHIIDDYIFLGSLDTKDREVPVRAIECIVNFVQTNGKVASEILDIPRAWRNGVRLYGAAIPIMNEDIKNIDQLISE